MMRRKQVTIRKSMSFQTCGAVSSVWTTRSQNDALYYFGAEVDGKIALTLDQLLRIKHEMSGYAR